MTQRQDSPWWRRPTVDQQTGENGDATKTSSKSGTRTIITTIVGRSKILYRGMDLMRTLTLICNLIALVLGLIVVAVTNPWKMHTIEDYCCPRLVPLGLLRTRLFFIFAAIPLINIGLASSEIYKTIRFPWSPRFTLITMVFSVVLLAPLVLFTMSCYWFEEVIHPWPSYCPYYWTIYGSIEMEGLNTNMINFTLIWLPPLMIIFYLLFLILAWIARRRLYTTTMTGEATKPSDTSGTIDSGRRSGVSSFGRGFYGAESISSDFNTSFNDSQRFSLDTLPTDSSSAASRPPSYRERARISELTLRVDPT